jgi:beta-mannosidase
MPFTLNLTSLPWELRDLDTGAAALPAIVPGCVHQALLARGAIPEPHLPGAEKSCAWIGEHDWLFATSFDLPGTVGNEPLALALEYLDCLAEVRLNGHLVGTCANTFRLWRLPVAADLLRATGNRLEILLRSPLREIARRATEEVYRDGERVPEYVVRHAWLRRNAASHGWDWGPGFPTLGVGPVRLEARPARRLDTVRLEQAGGPDGAWTLRLHAETVAAPVGARLAATLRLEDRTVAEAEGPAGEALTLRVAKPRLWWPRGLGEPVLHTARVELRDAEGGVLDVWERRAGLRELRLVQTPDPAGLGQSFGFEVNGRPFFAKGANLIPADVFPQRVGPERIRALVRGAAEAHMNMLRAWGGGLYEPDLFYDLCDEHGILVWQDFMFACGIYPAWDDAFLDNVRAEAEDQIRRLRHHACLALWCGNNEIEHNFVGEKWAREKRLWAERVMGRADYDRLFRATLGGAVARLDPGRPYISASPHDPLDPTRWPGDQRGDNHYWDAWFWGVPFAAQRSSRHRFVSEFGFQALPGDSVLERIGADLGAPRDAPANAALLEHHQRCPKGCAMLERYAVRECGAAGATLRAHAARTRLVQGLALRAAIEHWRASFGRTRGVLIWQLNDLWPALSWALLDHEGRPKLGWHFVRRAYAPLLVAAFEERGAGTVRLVAVNDHPATRRAALRWQIRATADDRVLEERTEAVAALPPDGGCLDLGTVELLHHANRSGGAAQVYLHFALLAEGSGERLFEEAVTLVTAGEFAEARPVGAPPPPGALAWVIEAMRTG